MRLEFFPYPLLAGLGMLVILLVLLRRKRSHSYLFCFSLFWLYLMFVVSQTIFPIPILEGLGMRSPAANILSSVNLVPFNYGRLFDNRPKIFLLETFGNILLTMPFGFGIPFLVRFKPKSFPWIVISPGFAIETAQLLFCLLAGAVYRSVDINDVLMNTIGSLLGYALFRGFAKLYLAISDHLKLKQSGLFAYISEVARYTFV